MGTTYHFTFPSGVTTFEDLELDNHYGYAFETHLPKFDVKIKGHSYHDDDGLLSFSVETHGPKGATIYNGYRDEGGLQVYITGGGFAGEVFYGAGTYDLTTLDLHALDKEDLDSVNDGEEIWILDPIRGDYYQTKASKKVSKGQTTLSLDMEGEVHEVSFNDEGEPMSGTHAEAAWKAVSQDQAKSHLAGLKK